MSNYTDEIRAMLAKMDKQENQGNQDKTQPPPEDIQDVYVLIVREHEGAEDQAKVVESEPVKPQQQPVTQQTPATVSPQQDSFLSAYLFVCFSLLLIFATLAFQLYSLFNPPIATITIMPKSQQVQFTGTVQLGRLIRPITISQSATTPTTGHGHQDARAATGTVTFYNGLFTQQTVAQGSVYTGQDGVSIQTTQMAIIPPGDPSTGYGTATVTAQALQAGRKGNIQAGDINTTINNGLLVRNNQFYNGQDERDFSTVSQQDMNKVSTPLKISIAQSMSGALQGQAKHNETLVSLPCSPMIVPNHQVGEEAIQVKVLVSETCSAIAYNQEALQTKATGLLSHQALQKLGTGYSLFGNVHIAVKQANVTPTTPHLVFLTIAAQGTWIYALSPKAQERLKSLIAGKTKQEAMRLLALQPGIKQASIHWSGFGDDSRVPKNSSYIHIILFVA